ncbi:MAG: response regulator transcription factor [Flavobacteriales bacterium]
MEAEQRPRVLLVETRKPLRSALRLNFELEGYDVTAGHERPGCAATLCGARFDAVVMDVMLPGMDGFTVVETIRLDGNTTPVLFLTARIPERPTVSGPCAGIYHLGKPFELEELLLRVAKLVQRSSEKSTTTVLEEYSFGGNHVDFRSYEVKGQGGLVHTLSQREMMLLRVLVEQEGTVVSREEILQKVWGYNVFPTTRTVDNFIVGFRKYFEPDPREPRHFHSVRGVGYKFTA